MKQPARSLSQKTNIATYGRDKVVAFRLKSAPTDAEVVGEVSVPVPLMYRLYHLGRAYDLPQLSALHPEGLSAIDFVARQYLISDLEQVTKLVNDAAMAYYVTQILALLEPVRGNTKLILLVDAR